MSRATLDVGRRFIVVVSTSSTTNVVCLNVGFEMRVSLGVDFDPITADVAPGTAGTHTMCFPPFAMLAAGDVCLKSKFSCVG